MSDVAIGIYFSDFFNIAPKTIENYGAFNISLINDLPLFIDPFLLFHSKKSEYQRLHDEIIEYVAFLRDKSLEGPIKPGLLKSWFYFSEIRQNWLGYSIVGNRGSGLGAKFAHTLNTSLRTIFRDFGTEDITKSSHLEKLSLLGDGVGKDNISDFTTNLIHGFLLNYTQTFARENIDSKLLRKTTINKAHFNYQTMTWASQSYELPFIFDDYVLLTPRDILTIDDTWINRKDLFERFANIKISVANTELRSQIENYFLSVLPPLRREKGRIKRRTKAELNEAVARTISEFPILLDYYIKSKEDNGAQAKQLSEEKVDETDKIFIQQLKKFAGLLNNETAFYELEGSSYDEAYKRVMFLKSVIENNDGYRLFYLNGNPIKREHDLQVIFRLTWFGSQFDVNREVNNGRGPVDYKISRGSKDTTLVEFKLASNSQLRRNLEKQVPVYEAANNDAASITVILYFNASERRKIGTILKELKLIANESIVLIDACADNKPSASTA